MLHQANKLLPLALAVLLSSLLLLLPATAPQVAPSPLSATETSAALHSAYCENVLTPGRPNSPVMATEALLEEREEGDFSLTGADAGTLPNAFHLRPATRQNTTLTCRLDSRYLTADHSLPLFLVTARIRI